MTYLQQEQVHLFVLHKSKRRRYQLSTSKERKEGTKLALCIGNAIRQSVVKLKTRLDAMPHKRRAHSGTCGTWYSVHGTWYMALVRVRCLHRRRGS